MKLLSTTTASLFVLGAAGLAHGQGATEQSGDIASENEKTFDTVIVTARKKSETLIEVPDQVTAFTATDVEEAGIDGLESITNRMPNLSLVDTQNPGTVLLSVRGVGQYRNGEAPVAVIIDGVQQTSTDALSQELFDVQQIEVLKGPQGALFGRNAMAGAINITTKKPSSEFEGIGEIGIGNGGLTTLRGVISGPLIEDKVLARLSASASDFDGVIDNTFLGEEADSYEDRNARLRILAEPSESVSLDFRASYSDLDSGASYFAAAIDTAGFAVDGSADTVFPVTTDVDGAGERTLQEYALKADIEFGDVSLTSVTVFTKTEETFAQDLDFTFAPVLEAAQSRMFEAWSEELRLSYDAGGPLDGLLGVYVLDVERELGTNVFGSVENIGAFSSPAFVLGNLSLNDFDLTAQANVPFVQLLNLEENFAWAVFANASYDFSDKLTGTLGLRYDEEERKQTDLINGGVRERTFDLVQPKISLAYQPTPDSNIYASWGKGFRSGGFNQAATVSRDYEAEEVASAELGFKSTWMDGGLTVNGAVFQSEFENRQDFIFIAGVQTILNFEDSEVLGAELEVFADLGDHFEVGFTGGILDTELESEPTGFDPALTGLPANSSAIGNAVPLIYGWSYGLSGTYSNDFSWGSLTARLDYESRGDLEWEFTNDDQQDQVNLVNARLIFDLSDTYSFTLWAENLFDEEYYQEFEPREATALAADIGFPAEGRTYGAKLKLRF